MENSAYYSEETLDSVRGMSCIYHTMLLINSFADATGKIHTNSDFYSLIDLMDFVNSRMENPVNDELFFWLFSEKEHGIELNKAFEFLNDKLILMLAIEVMDNAS